MQSTDYLPKSSQIHCKESLDLNTLQMLRHSIPKTRSICNFQFDQIQKQSQYSNDPNQSPPTNSKLVWDWHKINDNQSINCKKTKFNQNPDGINQIEENPILKYNLFNW